VNRFSADPQVLAREMLQFVEHPTAGTLNWSEFF